MQTLPPETEVRHVYRPSLRYRGYLLSILFDAIMIFAVYVVIGMLLSPHRSWQGAAINGLVFALISSWVTVVRRARSTWLIVTPDTFEFTIIGPPYWEYWREVERIGHSLLPQSLLTRGEGLILPRIPPGQVRLRSVRSYWRFVPLTWFAPDWRHSPLGDDIRRYAPWLVEG